jgi:hypothetical protein
LIIKKLEYLFGLKLSEPLSAWSVHSLSLIHGDTLADVGVDTERFVPEYLSNNRNKSAPALVDSSSLVD